MWLLEASTYMLKEFIDSEYTPPYAILSHTWEGDEVSFREVQHDVEAVQRKAGFTKVKYLCTQALQDGIEWVWVDTCCIDKSSSAELSEAINSMYAIYAQSVKCYVYMVDVPVDCVGLSDDRDQQIEDVITPTSASECSPLPTNGSRKHMSAFRWSRWFTRGWTLQELLAPPNVEFRNVGWGSIGLLHKLVLTVSDVTGIGTDVLLGARPLSSCCVAEKLSWAAFRATSRVEDQAYCLLGLFGVNMPLLYGERKKAFTRLQQELIMTTSDSSILAWHSLGMRKRVNYGQISKLAPQQLGDFELGLMPYWPIATDLLASSVADFNGCGNIRLPENNGASHLTDRFELDWTKAGLKAQLPVLPIDHDPAEGLGFAVLLLGCEIVEDGDDERLPLGLLLQFYGSPNTGRRCSVSSDSSLRRYGGFSYIIDELPQHYFAFYSEENIIAWTGEVSQPRWNTGIGYQRMITSDAGLHVAFDPNGSEVLFAYPESAVNQSARVLLLHGADTVVALGLEKTLSDGTSLRAVLLFLPRRLEMLGPPVQLRFTTFSSWHDIRNKLEEHGRETCPDTGDRVSTLMGHIDSKDPRIYRYFPFRRMGSAEPVQYVFDHLCSKVTAADSLMPFEGFGMFLASCEYDDQHLSFVRVKVCFETQDELLRDHALYVERNTSIWSELQQLYSEYGHIWHQPDDWTEESVKAGWLRIAVTT